MIILAIETSCDDTCVSLLEIRNRKLEIRSNIVSSQVKLHRKYGGVWPFLAKREHQKNLPIVLRKALQQAQGRQVNLIAVTVGPGLEPCLWVGVNFARDLAKKLKLPIISVNHVEAHIFANFLNTQYLILDTKYLFPAICLIVSGGHTQLILMKDFGQYKILGETRDDAAGECFDKTARILGLGYPGGPAIAAEAKKYQNIKISKYRVSLPRPMIDQKNYDFSFAGLKTAVLYDFKSRSSKIRKSKNYIREMAKEIQQAVIDVLISKTLRAAKEFKTKSIILGGGVVANSELRKQFKQKIQKEIPNTQYLMPNTKFCTDNAAMVALTGYFNWLKKPSATFYSWKKIEADANQRI